MPDKISEVLLSSMYVKNKGHEVKNATVGITRSKVIVFF